MVRTIAIPTAAAVALALAFRLPNPQQTEPSDELPPKPAICCLAGTDEAIASCEDHPGKPCLACIKKLEGSWYAADEDGNATEHKISEYRVTAGGNAVLETLFPGSDHEMISMYFMDGADLMLTHYCVLGAHPKLKATIDAESGQVVFVCSGAGENFASCQDTDHMHEGRITPLGENRYKASWTPMQSGVLGEPHAFDFVRGS